MPSFKIQEQILASPEEVFAFITKAENASQVDHSIRKTERLDEGPLRVGSTFQQIRSYRGHEVSSDFEVLEYQNPFIFSVIGEKEGIRSSYRYILESLGSGTEITLNVQVEAEGARRALAWLISQFMKRRDLDLLERVEVAIIKSKSS